MNDEIYEDGPIAFFAKGRITGEWLLTLAADTTKEKTAGLQQERPVQPHLHCRRP
ncbi:MAG: hypothetical protein SWC96_05635 [Thermodesulfobacteriota bacterium]|nr:hypothetical protein [Thermodesulfobacteriota bacterium]